jgi:hypothetical protein
MILAVDLDAESYAGTDPETLEQVIRIAASVCESAHRLHANLECRIGRETFSPGTSPTDLRRLLDFLARIPPGGLKGIDPGASTRRHAPRLAISLTSDQGLARRMRQQHSHSHEHWIVVGDMDRKGAATAGGVACVRPWIELSARCDLAAELPAHWRRRTYVAGSA